MSPSITGQNSRANDNGGATLRDHGTPPVSPDVLQPTSSVAASPCKTDGGIHNMARCSEAGVKEINPLMETGGGVSVPGLGMNDDSQER